MFGTFGQMLAMGGQRWDGRGGKVDQDDSSGHTGSCRSHDCGLFVECLWCGRYQRFKHFFESFENGVRVCCLLTNRLGSSSCFTVHDLALALPPGEVIPEPGLLPNPILRHWSAQPSSPPLQSFWTGVRQGTSASPGDEPGTARTPPREEKLTCSEAGRRGVALAPCF